MRTHGCVVPKLPPAIRRLPDTKHSQGQNKGNSPGEETVTLIFLNCQLECLKLRGWNYHIRFKIIILFWAEMLNLLFSKPWSEFLAALGPKPSCGSACFLLGMTFLIRVLKTCLLNISHNFRVTVKCILKITSRVRKRTFLTIFQVITNYIIIFLPLRI